MNKSTQFILLFCVFDKHFVCISSFTRNLYKMYSNFDDSPEGSRPSNRT